jgi:putative membrane protein
MDPANLPAMAYVWLKAVHIIAVIAWMAGLFYLPRLFVYHADAKPESVQSETFKVMERRLLGIIMNPAMVATWALGLMLAWLGGWWTAPWFLTKLALVVVMTWFHLWLASCCRDFAADANRRPVSTYRIINELPTILVIAIVVLAVVKPF